MSGSIRLLSPEAAAAMNLAWQDLVDSVRKGFQNLAAADAARSARAEQRRRDIADELDWLGEWGGRRR